MSHGSVNVDSAMRGGPCDPGPCQPGGMPSGSQTVPVPPRYSRVDPWVISSDTDAEIAFLESAFDAQETPGSRMLGPDGRIGHVEVELGDAVAYGDLGHPSPIHRRNKPWRMSSSPWRGR
jgi:hypothetical protein